MVDFVQHPNNAPYLPLDECELGVALGVGALGCLSVGHPVRLLQVPGRDVPFVLCMRDSIATHFNFLNYVLDIFYIMALILNPYIYPMSRVEHYLSSLRDDLESGLGADEPLGGRRKHGGGRLRPRG